MILSRLRGLFSRPSRLPSDDRLDSWKEIAVYLKRDVRTVQRWEIQEGLPICRRLGTKRGPVFAYRSELDLWWEEKRNHLNSRPLESPRRIAFVAGSIGLALILGGIVSYRLFRSPTEAPDAELKVIPFVSYTGSEDLPSLSPDGNQVAFAWRQEEKSDYDIYVKRVDSGQPLRLTDDPAQDFGPAWSPDGRRIAFYRLSRGRWAIYSVPSLGGSERKLADLIGTHLAYSRVAWSPDGEFLALQDRNSSKDPPHIFLLSLETHEQRQLTASSDVLMEHSPTFSPDGEMLAFVGAKGWSVADIYLLPVAGGEPKRLTFDNKGIAGLAWTPDGREIVFSSNRAGGFTLWRIPVSGGNPKRLAWAGEIAGSPAISRQGRRLVFAHRVWDISIYRTEVPTSTGQQRSPIKLIASTREDTCPYYSPDGKRIVFLSDRSGSHELWLCDSDGSNAVQLTSFGGPQVAPTGWSPDGTWIAFGSNLKDNWDVYVMNAEGGAPRRLTTHPGADGHGRWSPNGRWIYFDSNRTGSLQVWKVPAEGGVAVQVTKQGGQTPMVSADGKFVYYAKGLHAPGIWRMPAEGGEETLVLPKYSRAWRGRWVPVDNGIYFADWEGSGLQQRIEAGHWIKFLDFNTGRVKKVMPVRTTLLGSTPLSISPDSRWFLYPQVDHYGQDLMLVENFQ